MIKKMGKYCTYLIAVCFLFNSGCAWIKSSPNETLRTNDEFRNEVLILARSVAQSYFSGEPVSRPMGIGQYL
jgi:hypothetical protein